MDVLAGSPAEIDQVSERLNKPSRELATWVASKFGDPVDDVEDFLQQLLTLKTDQDLRFLHSEINKARRFTLAFKKYSGIVNSHLVEVSEAFPRAVFLIEYYDMQWSYSGSVSCVPGR